jgi:hypothetical protein
LKFREFFEAEFQKGFVIPANTFDNVSGQFPIGFMIWKLNGKKKINKITCDIFDKSVRKTGQKTFYAYDGSVFITDWFKKHHTRAASKDNLGAIGLYGSDFQHNNFIRVTNCENHPNRWTYITIHNLIQTCVYFTVRKVIPVTWLNDRDQFLYPNAGWENDVEFQNDCLTYTLFNNNISSGNGVNHWIPFSETEVNSRDKFDSHFMVSFLSGKIVKNAYADLFRQLEEENQKDSKTDWKEGQKREFSPEVQAVCEAGKELWKYYHAQPKCNVNASLYDIREHFQGRNEKGKMNSISADGKYNGLITTLRNTVKILAKKIEPKVYEYGFLKG